MRSITMTLPTHPLGNSGLHITRVGFGSWAVGGGGWLFGWGPQDDAASLDTMRHALELGINWIDTAAIYGLGHSEEVIGKLLRELPSAERPLIFTKCGLVWDEHDRMKPPPRMRSVAPQARCRAHRSVSIPLAGHRYARRGFLGRNGEAHRGGKDPRGRRIELRRNSARAVRGDPACGLVAAAVFADQSRGGREGHSLVCE